MPNWSQNDLQSLAEKIFATLIGQASTQKITEQTLREASLNAYKYAKHFMENKNLNLEAANKSTS